MNNERQEKLYSFLRDQLTNAEFRVKAYVFDEAEKRRPVRTIYTRLSGYSQQFIKGKASVRWITMYGLRGAGKTTILAQLYEEIKVEKNRKLFLSVDHVTSVFGVSLKDIIDAYEDIIGGSFEKLQEPVFLFLDEVQYDEKWGILLKTIYDRSNKVFIITTGSSALALQASSDVARRSIFEKLYPMSFEEYMLIKEQKEVTGISDRVRDAVFSGMNARQIHDNLIALKADVCQYWANIEAKEIDRYMQYGTLPFMIALNNEALIYDQIKKTLERVMSMDIPHIAQFAKETVSKIPMVLYAIAESDQLSQNKLEGSIGLSRPIISSILETLERTETIWRVYPHGSHSTQVRQPSKYLFTSPSFRSMYFNFIGSTRTKDHYMGSLLEDTVGLYLRRIFSEIADTSITYDSAAGGADFIVRSGNEIFIIEVGRGEKTFDQIIATIKKIGARVRAGILISRSPLYVNEEKNIVSIPLDYFLLM